ncbi:MAG TPA: glutamine--fructose-6-phosphate transaminase (isomerizing) [Candidatus Bathyarchaeia archaeon]|nr:glutamine--fructose-6-phosphate transaminase (isomerizing) [Candidatus Bathyarchaeia archaeon]
MCSIIRYSGSLNVAPVLVESLKRMEYRGYDSVGISTVSNGRMFMRKGVGRVVDVDNSLHLIGMPGHIGIGHTRWATHGGITDKNAHPHSGCTDDISVVHNGIVENYKELKDDLIRLGHKFKSDTDSEVIAHLLERHAEKEEVIQTIIRTCKRLKGTYAFVAAFEDGTICGSRYDEPLIIGIVENGYFISSDILGFLPYTDKAIFLDNKDIAVVEGQSLRLYDSDGNPLSRPVTQVAWELAAVDKGKFAHHTLKEIHEQTHTIMTAAAQNRMIMNNFCRLLLDSKTIYFTGSGTSYHSALLAKQILARFAKIRAESIMSSEFQYALDPIDSGSALLAISQSGETADVLQSVKAAKEFGAKILSIVNVPTSSLARISDSFLCIDCGPEVGVAATKSFTGQLSLLYSVVDNLCNGCIGYESGKLEVVGAIHKVLASENEIQKIADCIRDTKDVYIMGRSIHYPIALEAALKIKELAYIHAEGIAAGELKHGPLALIDRKSIVIIINPTDATYADNMASANEIKARGAVIIGVSDKPNDVYDIFIRIPSIKEPLYPLLEVIPFQILAYYLALGNKANPDYPRNLAKSVTVK